MIAGGSVGGLFAGVMLVRQGWDVEIFERVPRGLEARGAGIAGHEELTALLRSIEIVGDRPAGIDVSGRVAVDQFGKTLASYSFPQYLTSWNIIYSLLRGSFPQERYHLGLTLTDIEQTGGAATAILSNGERIEADLVVGADGFRSTIRGIFAPKVQPEYAGYVAWRCMIDEADLWPQFMAETFGNYTFCFPPRGQLIGYPLAGAEGSVEPGQRRYNLLWYRHAPRGEALDRLLIDEQGHTHEHSIPPPLIRRDNIQALRRDGLSDLPVGLAEVVQRADQFLLQPIYDVDSAQIAFDRVALVGDAAFVARPHVGIGVLKAAQDAAALVESLAVCATVPEALREYEDRRLALNIEAVEFGRHLGSFIERGLEGPTSDPSLGLSYEYIIRESARLPRVKPPAVARERVLQ